MKTKMITISDLKVTDYQKVCTQITQLIMMSGFKLEYVRKQLGYSKPGFYKKRKAGNFSPDELSHLLKIIRIETEPHLFQEMLKSLGNREVLVEG